MAAEAWIGLGGAVGGGLLTGIVTGWLNGRAQVAEELREQRLRVYPAVWEATRLVSRWPRRSETTYGDADRFSHQLRDWYYEHGGLFMSIIARRRYGHMQETAERVAALAPAPAELEVEDYTLLRDACSAFRSALTEDLESRRQRSLIAALPLAVGHLAERRRKKRRLAALKRREQAVAAESGR